MKTEVIIAVRAERPGDVKRTVDAILPDSPVCLVMDGKEEAYPLEKREGLRIVEPWARARGPGQCRHVGITTSAADIVIIMDAHMTVPKGWLSAIVKHLEKHPKRLTCCRTQALDGNWRPLAESIQNACSLDAMCNDVRNGAPVKLAVASRWEADQKTVKSGSVKSVMGACYGMRREWYDTIGQPLRLCATWGGDEEALSLGTHIMGGKCWLLPVVCGHVYKQHGGRVRTVTADEKLREWQTQANIVNALPCTNEEREVFMYWLKKYVGYRDGVQGCDVLAVQSVWATGLSWSDLKARGCVTSQAPLDKPQLIIRAREVCEKCGKHLPFIQDRGMTEYNGFSQARARCKYCGKIAHIRQL